MAEAKRRLNRHAGHRLLQENRTLQTMVLHVFVPNLRDVEALLERAETDEDLAVELVQNVHRPDVRERYHGELDRALHNHAASTATLVDQVRRVVKTAPKPVRDAFEVRRDKIAGEGEVQFVRGLRNFMLHYTLPIVGHSLSFEENRPVKSSVQLSTAQLLDCRDAWSGTAKTFIKSCGELLELRPVVRRQGRLVMDLHLWLCNAIEASLPIDEINDLVTEVNAALMDTDLETARNHPIHEMRRRPPAGGASSDPSRSI